MHMPDLPQAEASGPPQTAGWSRTARLAVSGLLLFHLCAITAAPWSVEPSSILSRRVWSLFRPYLEIAYLNHGYHFFAPEPGPGHLVRYELELRDGGRRTGFFPNRDQHRPRLLYHRHFMLSEHLNAIVEADASSKLVASYSASFAAHLLQEHKARTVKLYLMRHLIPQPSDVLKGVRLEDSRFYRERPLGTFTEPKS